jgi:hypothetical protein
MDVMGMKDCAMRFAQLLSKFYAKFAEVLVRWKMTTLRRERRARFEQILSAFDDKLSRAEIEATAELLADASESRTERKTDEAQGEYNVELFRGDWRQYPEHLHKIAEVLRDTWKFVLPEKPKKGEGKGQYKFYVMAMDALKQACAEFGENVLIQVHTDWRAGFKGGIAPYTVAQPSSLVNMANAKARELREKNAESVRKVSVDKNGIPETY